VLVHSVFSLFAGHDLQRFFPLDPFGADFTDFEDDADVSAPRAGRCAPFAALAAPPPGPSLPFNSDAISARTSPGLIPTMFAVRE
jgi:hypothetical protein